MILFAALLFILGMRLLLGLSASDGRTGASVLQLAVGIVSVGVAYALWMRRSHAMKAYWIWVSTWLVGGGIAQYVYRDVPFLHIAIWWVFVGSVLVFVGLYLRGAVKQTA